MSISSLFAYNPGSSIPGSVQYGNIAVGIDNLDYGGDAGGIKWWSGPDETLGYVIVVPDPSVGHTSPIGVNAGVGFKRSSDFSNESFLAISNEVAGQFGVENFSNVDDALAWMNLSGIPTTYPHTGIFDSETLTYISGLTTTLSFRQVYLVNRFITNLKTNLSISGLSESFDVMYILAGETEESSLRNLVKQEHDATAINSPIFTQYEGFLGNGTSSYLNTTYNPSIHTDKYIQDSASFSIYIRNDVAKNAYPHGYFRNGNPMCALCPRLEKDNRSYYTINSSSAVGAGTNSPYRSAGYWILNRPDSTTSELHYNKNRIHKNTNSTSTGLPNGTLGLCGNWIPSYYISHQVSFATIGRSFTTDEIDNITDTFEEYMNARGMGVIT